jgi:hypothetical protein
MTEGNLRRIAARDTARLEGAARHILSPGRNSGTRLAQGHYGGILLLLLLVSACSSLSSPRSQLLGQSYRDIQQSYIRPMPAREQALSSLKQLTVVDHDLSLQVSARHLVLEQHGKALRTFAAPGPDNWRGWGETVAAVTATAAVSPAIGELPSDAIDATLIDGTLSKLDRYSRYLSPRMLSLVSSPARWVQSEPAETHGNGQRPEIQRQTTVSQSSIPPLSPSVRISTDRGIALIRIDRFTPKTGTLVRTALNSRAALQGIRGIILDLRDNPGGNLDAAIATARLFLQHGIIVGLEARDPSQPQIVRAEQHEVTAPAVPLVVLIDHSSASSAEIVAAALQENGRALVVGSPSFGKGTVQTVFALANGGELWVTSDFSRAPSGYLLQGHGVVPDVCANLFGDSNRIVRAQFQALAERPRLLLGEGDWATLRTLCPDVPASHGDVALRLARRLILDQNSGWSSLEKR